MVSSTNFGFFADFSVAMAQMQMVVAAIYSKYKTQISPKTTDASMEVVDQITSAGPIVPPFINAY